MPGKPYWAGMGNTRWSAVQITSIKRKWATADRVNPSSNEVTKRGAKVKVAELVKRDPGRKGKDKPQSPPSEVFAKVREIEAESKAQMKDVPEPEPAPAKERNGKLRSSQIQKLLALLDDDSTVDDW
jgi:hypothetical protein